jgi:hypothetical protein
LAENVAAIFRVAEKAKKETSMEQEMALLHASFFLCFEPESGGDMFLRNVGWLTGLNSALS